MGDILPHSETTNSNLSSKTDSVLSRNADHQDTPVSVPAPCTAAPHNTGSALSVRSLSDSGDTKTGHCVNGKLRGWTVDTEKDGHTQTEEFWIFCTNCNNRVKVRIYERVSIT